MNREIKFRGRRLDNKEWVYGYFYNMPIRNIVASFILTNDFLEEFEDGTRDYDLGFHLWKDLFPVDKNTIGQFTGLTDKNGKEIYEGDIVKMHDPYNVYSSDYTGEVIWGKGRWKVPNFSLGYWHESDLYFDDFAGRKQKVIGNIHDNPELLK